MCHLPAPSDLPLSKICSCENIPFRLSGPNNVGDCESARTGALRAPLPRSGSEVGFSARALRAALSAQADS